MTYREGKVTRLQAWMKEQGEVLDGAYFYSDSRNDLPLLQVVDHPHVVNPDPALLAYAQQAGWPILNWR
jgi:phosphoserine phosphatase